MKTTTTTPERTQLDPDELTLSFCYADHDRAARRPIRYYDDGYGPLWILRDTCGIVGIVRCQTYEDAYEIAGDEFRTPIAPEDIPEAYGAYDHLRDYLVSQGHEDTYDLRDFANRYAPIYFDIVKANDNCPELIEGYEYQSNATGTGIVAVDLDGEALDPLTPELCERLDIEMLVTLHKVTK